MSLAVAGLSVLVVAGLVLAVGSAGVSGPETARSMITLSSAIIGLPWLNAGGAFVWSRRGRGWTGRDFGLLGLLLGPAILVMGYAIAVHVDRPSSSTDARPVMNRATLERRLVELAWADDEPQFEVLLRRAEVASVQNGPLSELLVDSCRHGPPTALADGGGDIEVCTHDDLCFRRRASARLSLAVLARALRFDQARESTAGLTMPGQASRCGTEAVRLLLDSGVRPSAAQVPVADGVDLVHDVFYGDLRFEPRAPSESARAYVIVTGSFRVGSGNPPKLVVERLRRIGGHLELRADQTLESLHMPALEQVGGRISVRGHGTVTQLGFPQLTRVGQLDIVRNSRLQSLTIPRLQAASSLHVEHNPKLETLTLGEVRGAGGRIAENGGLVDCEALDSGCPHLR